MASHYRSVFIVLALFTAVLLSFPEIAASAATVNPTEGTIGTTLTIAGNNFGPKKGTVFIGSKPSQVLAWGNTEIRCLVNVPLPPGEYDVTLNPQGNAPSVTLSGVFTIRLPRLYTPPERPMFVTAGEVITVGGGVLSW